MHFVFWAIQAAAALGLVAAYWQGWLADYVLSDRTGISQAIAILGIVGSFYMLRAWREQWGYERHLSTAGTIASWCVQLGLLGTLVGMLIALGGVVTASGAAELKGMVASLVEGMRIAIGTSIIGCIAALFLGIHRLAFNMAIGADDDGE